MNILVVFWNISGQGDEMRLWKKITQNVAHFFVKLIQNFLPWKKWLKYFVYFCNIHKATSLH
jgi:hypothetical protein